MKKATFIINARNKAAFVGRAVRSALAQTYPCEILLSDQMSEDGTFEAMQAAAADAPRGAEHEVKFLRCPIEGKYGMRAANAHTMWLVEQAKSEWVFQCSADDYSLPDRVKVCMAATEKYECSAVACTMYFLDPGQELTGQALMSGYPTADGYVGAGQGLVKLAYGSTIQGWKREFFIKAGSAGDVTGDVFHGYLAALHGGYYVVAQPLHVHIRHISLDNMGFEGKMRAAEASGDAAEITRINELNRFQLCELYYSAAARAQQLYPMAHTNDMNAIVNMILSQAAGWIAERKKLHEMGIAPGIL